MCGEVVIAWTFLAVVAPLRAAGVDLGWAWPKEGAIGWIIFDHPERRNAISVEMWREIPPAVAGMTEDDEIRVVVMKGGGEVAFVAGADISEFQKSRTGEATGGYDADAGRGVLALATPEGDGGALEAVAACEALGAAVFPGPLSATFLATQVLGERDRAALHMVEVEGLTYAEAGRRLGVGRSNMKMIMFRSRKRIRAHIQRAMEGRVETPPISRVA